MAKINGVEIKKMKKYIGLEGEAYQGDVYADGKKLGFWSQDGDGGPDRFSFDDSCLKERLEHYQDSFPITYRYRKFCSSPEVFMNDIVLLKEIEKSVKKIQKTYPGVIYMTDGFKGVYVGIENCEDWENRYAKDIENAKTRLTRRSMAKIHLFIGLSDFDIVADGNHPIPEWIIGN